MRYLYRAVRKEENDAGNILPKSQEPFRSDPIFGTDDMIFTAEGIEFGSVRNAIRHHQWQKERPYPWQKEQIPTSGVSTTPHFKRAKFYAKQNGVIVKIDRQLLNKFNIIEYDIKKYLRQEEINIPEDDEIILVNEEDGSFPKEIIVAFLKQFRSNGHNII